MGDDTPAAQTWTAERWRAELERKLGSPVHVVFTRARRAPVRILPVVEVDGDGRRRRTAALEVRLHTMFAAPTSEVTGAVASWIRSGRRAPRACRTLDRFIEERLAGSPERRRAIAVRTRGEHHDLAELALELWRAEFSAEFARSEDLPVVTWGQRGARRRRRSLRLGSFDPDTRTVRMNPILDRASVPRFFVRYVLFHELLHAVLPPRRAADERWVHHSREFRRRERAYVDYARAMEWERLSIRTLLGAAVARDASARSRVTPAASKAPSTTATPSARRPTPSLPERAAAWIQRFLFAD